MFVLQLYERKSETPLKYSYGTSAFRCLFYSCMTKNQILNFYTIQIQFWCVSFKMFQHAMGHSQQTRNVVTMSLQRHDVAATL